MGFNFDFFIPYLREFERADLEIKFEARSECQGFRKVNFFYEPNKLNIIIIKAKLFSLSGKSGYYGLETITKTLPYNNYTEKDTLIVLLKHMRYNISAWFNHEATGFNNLKIGI